MLSFTHYDMMSPPRLVGFSNYARLISDVRLAVVYKNTALFAVTAVILTVGIGTLLGVAVNKRLPGFLKYILRTAYFFPVLVGMIYAAMVWKFLFNRDLGVVNYYLHFFSVPPIPWLTSSAWAIWSVILVYVWKNVGFTMLTTLAGLQNISEELYEAAKIDGAKPHTSLFRITIPLLKSSDPIQRDDHDDQYAAGIRFHRCIDQWRTRGCKPDGSHVHLRQGVSFL